MNHTINVTDLTNQEAVFQVLSDIQNLGTSYSLVQNGVEVAKIVPSEDKICYQNDKVSDEVTKKRRATMERIAVFRESIAHMWNTDEDAAELVAKNRR